MNDPLDRATADTEKKLRDTLNFIIDQLQAGFDITAVSAVLANIETDNIEHTISQLELALNLHDGALEHLEESLSDTGQAAILLFGLFSAAGAIAAGAFGHILNTTQRRFIDQRDEYTSNQLRSFTRETSTALREAANRAVYSNGTPESRARHLLRTIGLTSRQASNLDFMRRFLLGDLAGKPTIKGNSVRSPSPDSRLNRVKGLFSAPQIAMLKRAIANPAFGPKDAEALLDRHAKALRNQRIKIFAGQAAHFASEGGKLAGWRVAQFFGAIPKTARRFWRTAGDERVRLSHSQVPRINFEGVPLDSPFQTPIGPVFAPPLEINCRCRAYLKVPL